MQHSSEQLLRSTRAAFIWTRIAGTPFWVLISLLTFILYKDMHITPLQITLIVALKPMSSLLAPYWSQTIYQRPNQITSNLVWANIFRYLPFLFLPWINSPWLLIMAFGMYMMLTRGSIPAWIEIFKRNLPAQASERLIAYGTTIDYCGNALLSLLLGFVLDRYEHAWRWLFPLTALVGLAFTWFLWRIPLSLNTSVEEVSETMPLKEHISRPWKHSWQLIKTHADFASFQIGFMLGGAGLMIMQPALPLYFVDTLNLSYTEMCLALTMCKGVGVVLASSFWTYLFRKMDIYRFSGLVTLCAAISLLLLLITPWSLSWLYVSYLVYGIMQSGSELSWHMSGLVFSGEKESSAFSGINVMTVGIRGCIIPAFGALLLSFTNSLGVMLLGGCLSLFATWHFMRYQRSVQQIKI